MLDFAHEGPTLTGDDLCDDEHRNMGPPPMHVRIGKTGDLRHKVVAGSSLDTWRQLVVKPRVSRISGPRTSCGEAIGGFYAPLEESYEGDLCPVCFTPFEIQLAAEQRAEIEAARAQVDRQRSGQRRVITAAFGETNRRLTTERMQKLNADGTQDSDKDEP